MIRNKILVIDDDSIICDFISEVLASEGFAYDISANANDALLRLEQKNYDLALLDIKLPGTSGLELLKTMQELHKTTSVIMITGMNEANTVVKAMKLGASDYMVKPFTSTRLIKNIKAVLTHSIYLKSDSLNKINAIAYGIDARIEQYDLHSSKVTCETIELAHQLGIPKEDIKKWSDARNKICSDRERKIESALRKLERNPMAQVALGFTKSIVDFPENEGNQN